MWQLSLPSLWEWIALLAHLWIYLLGGRTVTSTDCVLQRNVITTTSLQLRKMCCLSFTILISVSWPVYVTTHSTSSAWFNHNIRLQFPEQILYSVTATLTSMSHLPLTFVVFIFLPVCPHLPLGFLNPFESIEQGFRQWKEQISLVRGFLSLSISSWMEEAVHHLFQARYLILFLFFCPFTENTNNTPLSRSNICTMCSGV